MQKRTPLTVADAIILGIMVIALCIGVGRFLYVTVTFASIANELPAKIATAPGAAPLSTAVAAGLESNPVLAAWWAGRSIPRPKGDSYLNVLTERSTLRTLGPALGTIVERQKTTGVAITRVIVPADNETLLGGKAGTVYRTAGGGETSTSWAPPGRSATNFTDVPFVTNDYAPVLSDAQVASIEASATLSTVSRDIRLAVPAKSGSGTWILYAHPTPLASDGREFLLVPLELGPLGATP